MTSKQERYLFFITFAVFLLLPTIGYGSVESTLSNIQNRLINVILPLVAILGLVWAGLSFVMGNPNARNHLMLAIFGAVVGFGAPSIVSFIRGLVN
jgi:type IV secretory pathway VirB2 component (pilin)